MKNLQSQMEGGIEYELILKGTEEQTAEIKTLQGITGCEVSAGTEPGTIHVLVYAENEDIRELLFWKCAEQDLPILQMTPVTHSLEEIFLKVTEKKEEKPL